MEYKDRVLEILEAAGCEIVKLSKSTPQTFEPMSEAILDIRHDSGVYLSVLKDEINKLLITPPDNVDEMRKYLRSIKRLSNILLVKYEFGKS